MPRSSNNVEPEIIAGYAMPAQFDDMCDDFDTKSATFWLVPSLWMEYSGSDDLDWQLIKFDEDTVNGSRDLLEGRTGVYTLIIRSGVGNHPHCDYLVYVGKTEDQDFYTRWLQEVRLPTLKTIKQTRLRKFIRQWGTHMWACFADMDDAIDEMESELQKAWVPPANDVLPGHLNRWRRAFD